MRQAAKSDYIVTDHKDLLRLGDYGSGRIVTIQGFFRIALRPGQKRYLQSNECVKIFALTLA